MRTASVITDRLVSYADKNGYTSCVFENVRDPGRANPIQTPQTDVVMIGEGKTASMDPVTYDNNDRTITSEERFRDDYKGTEKWKSDDNRFSVRQLNNGKKYAWVDTDVTKLKTPGQNIKYFIRKYIEDLFSDDDFVGYQPESGIAIHAEKKHRTPDVDTGLAEEFVFSKYTHDHYHSAAFTAKMKAAGILNDLIEISERIPGKKGWSKATHPHNKDSKYGMTYYKSVFAFPVYDVKGNYVTAHAYDCVLLVVNASNGNKYLYDVVDITKNAVMEHDISQSESAKRKAVARPYGKESIPSRKNIVKNQSQQNSNSVRVSEKGTFTDSSTGENVQFSVRHEAPPQKTGTAYKVFAVINGKLYPPMVANPGGADTPVGVWLNADAAPIAGESKTGRTQVQAGGKGTNTGKTQLAYRPGWHLGDIPQAKQFGRLNKETGEKDLFPENFVWAECEYAMDKDYQEEAMSYGYTENGKFRHSYAGLPKIPTDGFYRYRTNPNPDTVPWVITGAMRVTRILNDEDTDRICREHGVEPMKRMGGPINLEKLGVQHGDTTATKKAMTAVEKDAKRIKIETDKPVQSSVRQSKSIRQRTMDAVHALVESKNPAEGEAKPKKYTTSGMWRSEKTVVLADTGESHYNDMH